MKAKILFVTVLLGLALSIGGVVFTALPVQAQVDTGLQEVGQTVKLASTDPRTIAANIINIALGLVGIVLVGLILYGGFLYMTSGGESAKVDKAKKVITNAIIGLIIVLSAWAITRYVIEKLLQATQEGGGVGGGGSSGYTGGFGGGTGSASFKIVSITPQGSDPAKPRNTEVKILLTKAVDEATASAVTVVKDGGTTVGITVKTEGSLITLTSSQDCPAPNQARKCFDADSDYVVKVGPGLKSAQGQPIACGGFAPPCEARLRIGNLIDVQGPNVSITYPTDGMSVRQNFFVDVFAHATDDSGVAVVQFFDGADNIGNDGPNATNTPLSFDARAFWDTAGSVLGQHLLSAKALDLDSNTAQSQNVSVMVRPEHCFNGSQDGGETGIDCGGDPNSVEYCGACPGGSCTNNNQCASGFCQGGVCVEKPIITGAAPLNGKPGTFVTIAGTNFGTSLGKVIFLGDPATPADDKQAFAPAACVSAGSQTWSNSQVTIAVPEGAASGPIELSNSASGLADRTDQEPGPAVADYVVDNTEHPGLCALDPVEDSVGKSVKAIGQGFGNTQGKVIFGSLDQQLSGSPWSDANVTFRVPVVNNGPYSVWVQTAVGISNPSQFTVLEKSLEEAPQLDSLDPTEGPLQQYVTLYGKNFGFTVGTVIFTSADQREAIGDTSFPAGCSEGFWRDDTIVVKVPSLFKNGQPVPDGTYQVKVKRSDNKESAALPFVINSALALKPGICAISPAVGPIGTETKIFGERFGTDAPFVTFSLSKQALVKSNTTQEIQTVVPLNSVSGPVTVKRDSATSNGFNFQVRNCNEAPEICGPVSSFQCCPTGECRPNGESCTVAALDSEYAWQLSTGLIPMAPYVIEECLPDASPAPTPSPSPWSGRAGGEQAPIDAAIVMRFSQPLEPTTAVKSAFRIFACKGSSGDPCDTKEEVQDFTVHLTHESTQQDVVTLTPAAVFAVDTTYLITASTNIKGLGETGANMIEDKECGMGQNNETYGYCFRFKTRSTTESSQVGAVTVAPGSYIFNETGLSIDYQAIPVDAQDRCIVLDCQRFNWNWSAGDTRGSVTNNTGGPLNYGLCYQQGMGHFETGDIPVDIFAALGGSSLVGKGAMYINFIPPRVVEYAPKCNEACSNALIWAKFSTKLDGATALDYDNVKVQKCFNENCFESELGQPLHVTLNLKENTVLEISHSPLAAGGFYRVLLRGGPNAVDPVTQENTGIQGLNGVPMTGTNHAQGFVWTFRVMPGEGAFCKAERVDVEPLEKYESSVDARQLFEATPYSAPDKCSADGQQLVNQDGTAWTSSDLLVADFFRRAASLIRSDKASLPIGCSSKCLAMGAGGTFGKVAMCGNGSIETTDVHYCVGGKTPRGSVCKLMPSGAKAGEECEPTVDGLDKCDVESCLFRSVSAVGQGGTCGDGVLQVASGEACDFGPICVGGSTATSTTPVPENSLCLGAAAKTACENAGGICAMNSYRGCSANCRYIGAKAGKTTCGNGDYLGDGKACDDGNNTDGDGCSSDCLHEASEPASVLAAVCGNGMIEPGETCEATMVNGNPVFAAGCDSGSCLHTGVLACVPGQASSCCGNATLDVGEDCDDGNSTPKDGCDSSCLLEGSDAYYSGVPSGIAPSFCGNGYLEKGEQCEVGASSDSVANLVYLGLPKNAAVAFSPVLNKKFGNIQSGIDAIQLAKIIGDKEPDPATGKSSSELSAVLMEQTGKATYGLQCGYNDEANCSPDSLMNPRGLDDFGCCRLRPIVAKAYPPPPPFEACRNVQIQIEFNQPMDTTSVTNNFEISQGPDLANNCPTGTQEVVLRTDDQPGIWNFIKRVWRSVVAWLFKQPAVAEKWCVGKVTGQLTAVDQQQESTKFVYTLDHALDATTLYRIRLKGDEDLTDNSDKAKRNGIKTGDGVVHDGDITWNFKTGSQICTLNTVTIYDVTQDPPDEQHPFLFVNKNNQSEERHFQAEPQSLQNGTAIPLSTTAEYQWDWHVWTTSDPDLVNYSPSFPIQPPMSKGHFVSVQEGGVQRNGHAILTAGIKVVHDEVNVPSSTGSVVQGVAHVAVLACENPWPSLQTSPFTDAKDWLNDRWADLPNVRPNIFVGNDPYIGKPVFYNFSTMYCRDAGVEHDQADDLPELVINQVPRTLVDKTNGILRQYLLTFKDETLKQDGIGIRIAENPQHLSPLEWYYSKGFTGKPKALTIDGYPAVQDGNTVYIDAANQPEINESIYSNIYVFSLNPDAQQVTQEIFKQLIQYLAFNINIIGQSNTCHIATNANQYINTDVYVDSQGIPQRCKADWECAPLDDASNVFCDANKLKMARDTQRMADFQAINKRLFETRDGQGRYLQLQTGTYLKGLTNSLWPSWDEEFGKILGAPPSDPVDKFLTCGQCADGKICQTDKDCGDNGKCSGKRLVNGEWVDAPDLDPQTCWDSKAFTYTCPAYKTGNPFSVSRLYQYRSMAGGTQYELASEFEVRPMTQNQKDWWYPALPSTMYQCVNPGAVGRYCANAQGNPSDVLCRVCANPADCKQCKNSGADYTLDAGVCAAPDVCQGVAVIQDACRPFGGTFKYADVCTNQAYAENGVCGDGVMNNNEICELGDTKSEKCSVNGKPGHRQLACNACTQYSVDPNLPSCVEDSICGNGRVDKVCSGIGGLSCLTDLDCSSNESCIPSEKCDEGVENGKYGHCNATCQGYAGFCGDAQLSPGEICDKGADNGQWSNQYNAATCATNCKGVGPYCGDTEINGSEECDGGAEVTKSAFCISTTPPTLCDTSADCPQGKQCAGKAVAKLGDRAFGALASLGNGLGDAWLNYVLVPEVQAAPPPPQSQSSSSINSIIYMKGLNVWSSIIPLKGSGWQVIPGQQVIPGGGGGQQSGTQYVDVNGNTITVTTVNSCDGVYVVDANGVKRETQHVRNCNAPGAASSCKWSGWTACVPVGICGDGIKDLNEACDNGAANGDTKACTSQCEINTCGDGLLNVGVEECDAGSQNGQTTCNADYDSSCLSCSTLCKLMASAGGYCGDGIKNGPEQCDGSQGLTVGGNPVTCSMLGYDYGDTSANKATCASDCNYGGCKRCSDEPGDGVIEGRVYDAVFQQVIPNARVSLMYKGVKVDEMFTDQDGVYKFITINKNASCTNYRLVIDMYQDNVCTGQDHPGFNCFSEGASPWVYPYDLDEGSNGGYFSFTTDLFSFDTYKSVLNGEDYDAVPHVDIFPRPERGRAYMAMTWKPSSDTLGFKVHTTLPSAAAYTVVDFDAGETAMSCEYTNRPAAGGVACARDINWRSAGSWKIDDLPYTRMVCLRRVGEKTSGWNYDEDEDDYNPNGCPFEGVEWCLSNAGKTLSSCGCTVVVENDRKKTVCTSTQTACKECGADTKHKCSHDANLANCANPIRYGPTTVLTNYTALMNQDDSIKFNLSAGPGDSSSFKSVLSGTSRNIKAYTAITTLAGASELQVMEKPTGSGWLWEIAYLGPKLEKIAKVNALKGSDTDQTTTMQNTPTSNKPSYLDGWGAWSGNFQGGGNNYCVSKTNNNHLHPTIGPCYWANTEAACGQTADYQCGKLDEWVYHKYNW
ncbi:MAG: Ig-like domain-containing protein [Patescibacteria group bacterium]|nr:Ig-like domain-containing protein [Patescibacteria group bacterium]